MWGLLTCVKNSVVFANNFLIFLEVMTFLSYLCIVNQQASWFRKQDNLVLIKLRKGNKNEKIVYGSRSHAEHDDDICRERDSL